MEEQKSKLVVEMPKSEFSETALFNLQKLIESKGKLMMKAFETDSLTIEQREDRICFPWFSINSDAEEIKVYTHFISALCKMAKTQRRINACTKDIKNEKYAFRCFLLRLGFVGDAFKFERKVLLKNLPGNSAYRNGVMNNE